MRLKLVVVCAVSFLALAAQATGADRISYDNRCFKIDGKPLVLYSGAFHYFRCPKELWPDRFRKIKEAGFNAVETYIAWNAHEPQPPTSLEDFSKVDLKDVDEWLTMAEEQFGLYTIVRPGPYICAEWDGGGFPRWLVTKKPAQLKDKPWLRTDDPTFLQWSAHWLKPVCKMVAPHQVSRRPAGKPGVILFQLENEYDYFTLPTEKKANHIRYLAQTALDGGIDVPLFGCWTKQARSDGDPLLAKVFDTCNFYTRWNVEESGERLAKLRKEQPGVPLMVTELQGGWFSSPDGKLSEDQDGLTSGQLLNLTLYCYQNGMTASNYYMLFGGTNFGDRAARNITTTYDYTAPIRESGGVDDRYRIVAGIGAMLKDIGPALAVADLVPCDVTGVTTSVEVTLRRAPAGESFLFIRNRDHLAGASGTASVKASDGQDASMQIPYTLEPFGSQVIYMPKWGDMAAARRYPEIAAELVRPAAPKPVRVKEATRRTESITDADRWTTVAVGTDLAQLGVYDCRYVAYGYHFDVPAKLQGKNLDIELLGIGMTGDGCSAMLNGAPVAPVRGSQFSWHAPEGLKPAGNVLLAVYENAGFPNGGDLVDHAFGLGELRLRPRLEEARKDLAWKSLATTSPTSRAEVAEVFDDSSWAAWSGEMSTKVEIFRAAVELQRADIEAGLTRLRFESIDDKGEVFINGKSVGKHRDWARPAEFSGAKLLHPGRNTIAVVVENTGGAGGLRKPAYLIAEQRGELLASECAVLTSTAGLAAGWDKAEVQDANWNKVQLDVSSTLPRSIDVSKPIAAQSSEAPKDMLTWFRLPFELPAPGSGTWAPWRVRLDLTGNGFAWLNGHPVGRLWENGCQREYYLPECWLNFGAGARNVLTFQMRSTGSEASIKAAEVSPYAEFAESR